MEEFVEEDEFFVDTKQMLQSGSESAPKGDLLILDLL